MGTDKKVAPEKKQSKSKEVRKKRKDFATAAEWYEYIINATKVRAAVHLNRLENAKARAIASSDPKAKIKMKIERLQKELAELG